jgi:hypothetical protein
MIQRSIRLMWRGAILAFLVYLLFIVQLGERSAFGHLMRVMKTDEAQELGHEVSIATRRIAEQIGDQVKASNATEEIETAAAKVPEAVQDELEEMVGEAYAQQDPFELPSQDTIETTP